MKVICQEHGVTVDVDEEARIIRHATDAMSVASPRSPVGGCSALRLAAKALLDATKVEGPHGPINPNTGRARCYLVVLRKGDAEPTPPWVQSKPAQRSSNQGPLPPPWKPKLSVPVGPRAAGGRDK